MRDERRSAPRLAAVTVGLLAALGVVATLAHRPAQNAAVDGAPRPEAEVSRTGPDRAAGTVHTPRLRAVDALDLSAHSATDPSSIWVVVNKAHPVSPLGFRPRLNIVRGYQVARAAAVPLARLLRAGDAAGMGFKIASAFRSFAYQEQVHEAVVASVGTAAADRTSARAGYSEHQTGLAVDLITPAHPGCDFDACFADTPAGRWLAHNAARYGFILRYTARSQAITGYRPEPWHIRYVGRPLAVAMRTAGITTLERVFHVTGGDYR